MIIEVFLKVAVVPESRTKNFPATAVVSLVSQTEK